MTLVVTALATVGALTAALATLLVIANRVLHVYEDPRIDIVEDMLPAANCGACGYPGCRPFAEALVSAETSPASCTVSPEEGREAIAEFLGVDVGTAVVEVARLACAGGQNVARNHATYSGLSTCAARALISGGGKGCSWGCLGLGDCMVVCDFDAIHMNEQLLPVVNEDLCTACGDCVEACPVDLFSIVPLAQPLWVACRSLEAGDEILEECEVACTACGRCAMDAPGLITMRNNLPVIDPSGGPPTRDAIERCPTGAIVWMTPGGAVHKGAAAAKIIRKEPRNAAPT